MGDEYRSWYDDLIHQTLNKKTARGITAASLEPSAINDN
jgi:hypothetical protein